MRDRAAEVVDEVMANKIVPELVQMLGADHPALDDLIEKARAFIYLCVCEKFADELGEDQYGQPTARH